MCHQDVRQFLFLVLFRFLGAIVATPDSSTSSPPNETTTRLPGDPRMVWIPRPKRNLRTTFEPPLVGFVEKADAICAMG